MFAPLDLVSAHPWRRAAFTTYALSLSFFEAVLLDALVRSGARESLILSDVEGVRMALGEQGARRVGKDYHVEPLAVRAGAGVFHPKISVLSAEDDCHLLVGSGNLTFGGWGGNFEVIEHLHPSFAADAIEDAADFFDHLALADRVRHGATDRCAVARRTLPQLFLYCWLAITSRAEPAKRGHVFSDWDFPFLAKLHRWSGRRASNPY
jgi:hypothetical protein